MNDQGDVPAELCPSCGHYLKSRDFALPSGSATGICSFCGARINRSRGGTELSVTGSSAAEVGEVTELLDRQLRNEWEQERLRRGPWTSGSFYLAVTVVVAVVLLAVAKIVSFVAVPFVVVGVVLLVAVIGALQLRQDDRLSERGFLRLMGDALKQLALIGRRSDSARDDEASSSVTDTP